MTTSDDKFFFRAEVITLESPGISMVDYSLEPVYYDPQLMMHIVRFYLFQKLMILLIKCIQT